MKRKTIKIGAIRIELIKDGKATELEVDDGQWTFYFTKRNAGKIAKVLEYFAKTGELPEKLDG